MAESPDRQINLPSDSEYPQLYDNVGLDVTVWLSASLMLLIVILKLALKFVKLRRLFLDDALIVVAVFIAVGQSIAVLFQVGAGLGHDLAVVSIDKFVAFQKTDYASQILYVLATGLTKAAFAATIDRLSPVINHRICARTLLFVSGMWTLAGMLGTLLQCVDSTAVWMTVSPSCFDQTLFWDIISAFDIGIDASMVILVMVIMGRVDASMSRKAQITAVFSMKLVSIPLVTLRIVFNGHAVASFNRTADGANVTVVTQLAMNLGIIAVCLPYLKACACNMEGRILHRDYRLRRSVLPKKDFKAKPYDSQEPREPPKAYVPKSRPAPIKTRHISVRAERAKSLAVNTPFTPSKMKIEKFTSFWVEEEDTPRDITADLSGTEEYYPG